MSGADDDGGAAGGVPVVSLSAFADSAAPSQRDDLASAQNSGRYGYGDTDRSGNASASSTRPQSAAMHHSSSVSSNVGMGGNGGGGRRPGQLPMDEPSGPASEASRAAALEARAAALREAGGAGGGGGTGAPVGLNSYNAAGTQQQSANGQAAGGAAAAGGAPTTAAAAPQVGAAIGLAHMQATMFGLGSAPVAAEVTQRVTVPRLDDLLIKALADNYHICPAFDWIPAEYLDNVVGLLSPGKLDFATAAALVQAEQYWARLARERWGPPSAAPSLHGGVVSVATPVVRKEIGPVQALDLALHGQSWKRLYCEKHLQECLEQYHHSKAAHNYKRLLREVEACRPYVHSLRLSSLQSHLDLHDLLFDFPCLSSLSVRLGPGQRKVGMDYDKGMFGATLGDAASLAKLFGHGASGLISRVELRENMINDEHVLLLLSALHPVTGGPSARSITYLDLSHNKIGDLGARKLAALIDGGVSQDKNNNSNNGGGGGLSHHNGQSDASFVGTTLTELNLSDNHIRSVGAGAFGAALANNRGLRKLDLSLNSLADGGGAALLAGCTQHTSLRELVISSTDLGFEAAAALLELLKFNRSLDTLQLACNPGLFEDETANKTTTAAAGNRSGNNTGRSDMSGSAEGTAEAASPAGALMAGELLAALRQNEQMVSLDMRRNGLPATVDEEMKQLLAQRLARVKQAQRKAFQKEWDAAM